MEVQERIRTGREGAEEGCSPCFSSLTCGALLLSLDGARSCHILVCDANGVHADRGEADAEQQEADEDQADAEQQEASTLLRRRTSSSLPRGRRKTGDRKSVV